MRMGVLLAAVAAILLLVSSAAAQPTLTVNITSFLNNDPVAVTLSGVTTPTINDSVGVFLASAFEPDVYRPLKYKWAVTGGIPGAYLSNGTSKLTFNLLNQRDDVVFAFFSGFNTTIANTDGGAAGFTTAYLMANSSVITNAAPNAPQHGHLALTGQQGEMRIQWTTKDLLTPEVMWGLSNTSLTNTRKGAGFTYNISNLCGAPATTDGWVDPGTLNSALMTGLASNTRYYYKYGSTGEYSKVYSFLTAPQTGDAATVKMILIADLGHTEIDYGNEYDYDPSGDSLNLTPDETDTMVEQTLLQLIYDNAYQQPGSRKTTQAITADLDHEEDKTLFVLNGDVSYARGMQTMWDVFMDQLQPIATQVPWMLTNGNHERDYMYSGDRYNNDTFFENFDSGGECGLVYNARFQMPKPPGPARVPGGYITRNNANGSYLAPEYDVPEIIPLWYSYNHGPIHMLVYSTELDFSPGSPQYEFMEADLKAVNRSVTPWVILNGHRPIYTTSTAGAFVYGVPQVAADLKAALEPLLYTYAVDLTLHGHDHIYERTCSIYNFTCMPDNTDGTQGGITHVVIGNSGYELSWFFNPFYPSYWEKIAVEHGYMRCEVNAETLYCQELSSFTGNQLDEFTLKKPAGWLPDTTTRAAFASSFVRTYVPTEIELNGFQGQPYGAIETFLIANLSANAVLLQNIIDQNELMGLEIDHAIERPDTLVDDCMVLSPAITIIKEMIASNETTLAAIQFANSSVLPLYEAVCAAALNYKNGGGIIQPVGTVIGPPVPLKVGFAAASGIPYASGSTTTPTAAGGTKLAPTPSTTSTPSVSKPTGSAATGKVGGRR